jgi:hypothetical protein
MNNFSAHIDKIHGKLIFPSNINNYFGFPILLYTARLSNYSIFNVQL